jgi:hypothetical protein
MVSREATFTRTPPDEGLALGVGWGELLAGDDSLGWGESLDGGDCTVDAESEGALLAVPCVAGGGSSSGSPTNPFITGTRCWYSVIGIGTRLRTVTLASRIAGGSGHSEIMAATADAKAPKVKMVLVTLFHHHRGEDGVGSRVG